MSDMISELRIIEEGKTVFDSDLRYTIPLYQRAYTWSDKELIQLIEDISGIQDDSSYYIGTLIVSKNDRCYEVIDGQQRLTSLYLLLNCLGVSVRDNLTFACREKSNNTLRNIHLKAFTTLYIVYYSKQCTILHIKS